MNQHEMRLAGELLKLASDKFANNICNDFKRPDWFPVAAWDHLHEKMHLANSGNLKDYAISDCGYDWWLMEYLGEQLTEWELHGNANCIHCGLRGEFKPYDQAVAETLAHGMVCEKHPMRALERELEAARMANDALAKLLAREMESHAMSKRLHKSFADMGQGVWDTHQKQFDEQEKTIKELREELLKLKCD